MPTRPSRLPPTSPPARRALRLRPTPRPSPTGPEGSALSIPKPCRDAVGNSGQGGSPTFKLDRAAPEVTVALGRAPDHNGWYNHAVDYAVAAHSDATSGIASCDPGATYSGPDDARARVSLSCRDEAGNTGSDSKELAFDATAPEVTVALGRAPDHNGWYNHAVDYAVAAHSDATSGIASCDPGATYSGPDDAHARVSLSCRDEAGNTGSDSKELAFDATAPEVTVALGRAPDHNGWYNHAVDYAVAAHSDATSGIASCDPGATYSGPDDAHARVSLSCR